ncbi:MAG TPA: lysylphosphatidylglycerol synthase transmembrane domain-containing protein [Thermoanaerobaculia bacterium]
MNPEEPVQEPRAKAWWGRLLKYAIVALSLYFTWYFFTHTKFDWSRLARQVSEAHGPFLVLGVILLLARFAVWDWRFRLAVRRALGHSSGVLLGFFVLLGSAALNLITPTVRVVGGMMRARYFARANGRPFGLLYGVVLYDQMAHHAVMILCTWITLIATSFTLGRNGFAIATLLALLASIAALAIWSRRRGPYESNPIVRFLAKRAEKSKGNVQSVFAHGHEAVGILVRLLSFGRLHAYAAVLGVAYFFVNAAAQWVMFLAMGAPVDPFVVIAAVALGTAAGTLTATPGGIGTTEVAMMASYKLLGVDEILSAAGILLYRGLHYASLLALGLPALAVLEWRGGQGKQGEEVLP